MMLIISRTPSRCLGPLKRHVSMATELDNPANSKYQQGKCQLQRSEDREHLNPSAWRSLPRMLSIELSIASVIGRSRIADREKTITTE